MVAVFTLVVTLLLTFLLLISHELSERLITGREFVGIAFVITRRIHDELVNSAAHLVSQLPAHSHDPFLLTVPVERG